MEIKRNGNKKGKINQALKFNIRNMCCCGQEMAGTYKRSVYVRQSI